MTTLYTTAHISSIDGVVDFQYEIFTKVEDAKKYYNDLVAETLDAYKEDFDDDFDYENDEEDNSCSFASDELNFDKIYIQSKIVDRKVR